MSASDAIAPVTSKHVGYVAGATRMYAPMVPWVSIRPWRHPPTRRWYVSAMIRSRHGCHCGMRANVEDVEDESLTNARLVHWLFYYTAHEVKARQRGHMRQAVWYRRSAREIGSEIRKRVERGTWK